MWVGILLPLGIHLWKIMQLHNSCLREYIMFRINEKMKRNLLVKQVETISI